MKHGALTTETVTVRSTECGRGWTWCRDVKAEGASDRLDFTVNVTNINFHPFGVQLGGEFTLI